MKKIIISIASLLLTINAFSQESLRMLIGTYTENSASEGIYYYEFNLENADARLLHVAKTGNPSFVITNDDCSRAYCVNEFNDGREAVSSFAIEGDSLRFMGSCLIRSKEVSGADPCNLLYTGEALISSNYSGGSFTSFRLNDDGVADMMSQYFEYGETLSNLLLGNEISEEAAHMHCAVISPDGKYIFGTNLGNDCIHRFELNEGHNPLGKNSIAWSNKGIFKAGPRHMIFDKNGHRAYMLGELSDELFVFSYNEGFLTQIQRLKAYKGRGKGSADIHISPDGRFLYTSHRLKEDGISIFSIEPQGGTVRRIGFQRSGIHPRNFAITPDGKYLLCACRDSNRVEIYEIDQQTGLLSDTGKVIPVKSPVCVQFLISK
ncbi:MAG: lactonase family protein [Bacteroidales bacterium]|nr:lactonase family protein [Bacteroidales bacterium]